MYDIDKDGQLKPKFTTVSYVREASKKTQNATQTVVFLSSYEKYVNTPKKVDKK